MERLIEEPENRRLEASRKHNAARQGANQSVRDFVAYIETIKYELKSLTTTQQRNHLLMRLKPNISQTITTSANIPVTKKALAARATRIENALPARNTGGQNNQNNQSGQGANLSGGRNPRKRRRDGNSSRKAAAREPDDSTTPSRPDSQRRSNTDTQLFANDSNDAPAVRKCYNCGEADHIARNCPQPQKNPQVNAVEQNSRTSFQADARQAPSARPISDGGQKSEN